jgi:hypothetical protein
MGLKARVSFYLLPLSIFIAVAVCIFEIQTIGVRVVHMPLFRCWGDAVQTCTCAETEFRNPTPTKPLHTKAKKLNVAIFCVG